MKLLKMQQKLLDASMQSRNRQAIQRLADMDSLRDWGSTSSPVVFPKYEKPVKIKWSYTLKMLARQFLV